MTNTEMFLTVSHTASTVTWKLYGSEEAYNGGNPATAKGARPLAKTQTPLSPSQALSAALAATGTKFVEGSNWNVGPTGARVRVVSSS